MPKDESRKARFFRADEDVDLSERTSPSPNEWFGTGRSKFKSKGLPSLSDEQDTEYDGWRQFFRRRSPGAADPIEFAPPLENPLLPPKTREKTIKFKDEDNDTRTLVFVLEQAAEVFEAEGHIDLAAECERICELVASEEKG
jgi:hypothetical protein